MVGVCACALHFGILKDSTATDATSNAKIIMPVSTATVHTQGIIEPEVVRVCTRFRTV